MGKSDAAKVCEYLSLLCWKFSNLEFISIARHTVSPHWWVQAFLFSTFFNHIWDDERNWLICSNSSHQPEPFSWQAKPKAKAKSKAAAKARSRKGIDFWLWTCGVWFQEGSTGSQQGFLVNPGGFHIFHVAVRTLCLTWDGGSHPVYSNFEADSSYSLVN